MTGTADGIILASASPRRRELLKMLGIENLRIIPALGEEKVEAGLPPEETVKRLALEKAREVYSRCGESNIIIAADTIVYMDGEILGKPEDEAQAAAMLGRLQGRTHSVFTGVALIVRGTELVESQETAVTFREISGSEILAYVKTGEPMDKAGAYGAQGIGSIFIEHIDGDFYNVVGLPLCRLGKMLGKIGVELI